MPNTPFYDDPERWDSVAADYDRWAFPFTSHFARAALARAGGLARGARVLDVAAGTGALALAAAEAGAEVLATDISQGMIARLAAKLAPFPGCAARVMDGQALPLEDDSFDAGFSVFGIMLFPDWRRGLAELVRVVKPGGTAVIASWIGRDGAGPMIPLLQAYRGTFPHGETPAPPDGMAAMSDAGTFTEALRAAGCADIVISTIDGEWTAPSLDAIMENLDALTRFSPLFAALDDAGRAALAGPLREAFAAYAASDGTIRVPSTAHVGVGRKAPR